MLDRDEIIRRIISGDMSRGGADFAARMMQQTMPAEQLRADARNAQIAQIVRQGQERARMLALEPNLMGPEDMFMSVNPSYTENRPDRFVEYPPLPQQGLPTGGLPPNPRALGMVDAMANNMPPQNVRFPEPEPDYSNMTTAERLAAQAAPYRHGLRNELESWVQMADQTMGVPVAVGESALGMGVGAFGGVAALSGFPEVGQEAFDMAGRRFAGAYDRLSEGNVADDIAGLQRRLAANPSDREAAIKLTDLIAAQQNAVTNMPSAKAGDTVPTTAEPFMSGGIGMPEGMDPLGMPEIGMGGAAMVPAMLDGGPAGTPLASPQAGLPTPPGPMMLPAVTPPGGGGGTGGIGAGTVDLANLPSAADVSPLNPEAYNPETGTRPPEARALSIWDRMFGEVGSDQRAAVSQGLIRMGAAMMQSKGDLGQALGEGIEAGLLEFDATTKALADEAKEAKQMGMEEEAHELNMALKRLQLARAQSGGGGGARTSGVVENPFESKASDFAAWSALLDTDPRFAGLNPEVKNRIALNQSGFITAGSIMSGQNPDPLAAYLE